MDSARVISCLKEAGNNRGMKAANGNRLGFQPHVVRVGQVVGLPPALLLPFLGQGHQTVALGLVRHTVKIAAAFGLWPPGRRLLVTRAWCVITPHRLRTGCANAWINSRYGRLPIILLTTAQPFGERVLLWCVAGVSAEDLVAAREALIAACWAADIKVNRSDRHRQLVIVDVIRRPPNSPASPEADRLSWPG